MFVVLVSSTASCRVLPSNGVESIFQDISPFLTSLSRVALRMSQMSRHRPHLPLPTFSNNRLQNKKARATRLTTSSSDFSRRSTSTPRHLHHNHPGHMPLAIGRHRRPSHDHDVQDSSLMRTQKPTRHQVAPNWTGGLPTDSNPASIVRHLGSRRQRSLLEQYRD